MRFENIKAHGNPLMVTPNMDRLVHHGLTFINCFVQNPVCIPSRCSFMTGLYPQQIGVTWNGHCIRPGFYPTLPLNPSREMLEPYVNLEIAPPLQVDPLQAVLSQIVDH